MAGRSHPSAGKTTLLNGISGWQKLPSGEITLSGVQFGKQLRCRLGFVLQNDVFFSNLTLWETLYFTAMIRLPESVSKEDKLERLEDIIDALDIRKCRNTLNIDCIAISKIAGTSQTLMGVVVCFIIVIGDNFVRGLLGGEKKRASIASELLTDPDILLLDGTTKRVCIPLQQDSDCNNSSAFQPDLSLVRRSSTSITWAVAVLKLEKTRLDELVQMNKTAQLIQPCKGNVNAAFIDENGRNADVKVKAGDLCVSPTKREFAKIKQVFISTQYLTRFYTIIGNDGAIWIYEGPFFRLDT
ncbi:AB14G-like protein [Mya arenaria]|uniref:AB14G-like protein n=1 Tax=Mya arenaria TaxID=6604 RepID=A0ABY7DUI0_MYAAR|nr:AB14G-like protein [Mya arenaria]